MRFTRRVRPGDRRRTAAAILVILVLAPALVIAQNPTLKTRTSEERELEFQATHRVTLNVQVTDAAGKPVTDLGARDFAIFDNLQPRKLATFHVIDGQAMNDATEVVILLDAVNSPTPALEAGRASIFKFLAASHRPLPYPTSFVLWSDGHLKATAATTDRNAVGRAFVRFTRNLHSNACSPLDDPAAQAVETGAPADSSIDARAAAIARCSEVHFTDSVAALDGIAQQQLAAGGRTILIWVGPGWPLFSDIDFQRLTPAARKRHSGEIATLLHDLEAAQITLDAIDPRNAAPRSEIARVNLNAAPPAAPSPAPGSFALQLLAQQTGGRSIEASTDLSADLNKLLDDAAWYYALSFNPPPAQSGVELRPIAVRVNRPGLTVRTATEYYAAP